MMSLLDSAGNLDFSALQVPMHSDLNTDQWLLPPDHPVDPIWTWSSSTDGALDSFLPNMWQQVRTFVEIC